MKRYGPSVNRTTVEKQATKARKNGTVLNLSGADFTGADWSGVDFTSGAYQGLFNSQILGADFRSVRLVGANLFRVDLACANLRGADLSGAVLTRANLYTSLLENANLTNTDLRGANLVSAELNDITFGETRFAGARLGRTSLSGVDLSKAAELDQVLHVYPSAMDATTLQKTANGLSSATEARRSEVLRFLGNIGLPEDLLSVIRSWIGKPIEFYSVFLSHSSLDKDFCRALYQDLRSLGVNCWYDEHQILPGDSILEAVDRGVKLWDKLIFVASENSLSTRTGWWAEQELERALRKEREGRRTSGLRDSLVIPVAIDEYFFEHWESPHKATLMERRAADFRDWRDPQAYAKALENLVKGLNTRKAG